MYPFVGRSLGARAALVSCQFVAETVTKWRFLLPLAWGASTRRHRGHMRWCPGPERIRYSCRKCGCVDSRHLTADMHTRARSLTRLAHIDAHTRITRSSRHRQSHKATPTQAQRVQSHRARRGSSHSSTYTQTHTHKHIHTNTYTGREGGKSRTRPRVAAGSGALAKRKAATNGTALRLGIREPDQHKCAWL